MNPNETLLIIVVINATKLMTSQASVNETMYLLSIASSAITQFYFVLIEFFVRILGPTEKTYVATQGYFNTWKNMKYNTMSKYEK